MLSVRSVAVPALLALLAPLAQAEDIDHFLDVRVGASSVPRPDISEKVKGTSGPNVRYDWEGLKSSGVQIDASATAMCLHDWGGVGGAVHLVGADYDITPTAIRRADGVKFSPGGEELHQRTLGAQIAYGYGYATSRNPEDFAVYLEVMPFIGGGGAQSDTVGLNVASNTVVKRSGYGYYSEYGLRCGAYFTERSLVAGVTGFYVNGTGKVTIDLDNGAQSRIYSERSGWGFGGELGWRF